MWIADLYKLRIDQTIDKLAFMMLKNPNIVGVGRENKIINGKRTAVPRLTIYYLVHTY